MKKIMFLATALLVLAVSCSKNKEPQVDTQGVPMTLKVKFDDVTKVSYERDGKVLKSTWDASETISVVTLEAVNGKICKIDNFTSTGAAGRERADFTGTFTGGISAPRIVVVYPAIVSEAASPYTKYNGETDNIFYGVDIDDAFVSTSITALRQTANDDANHLKNFCILSGVADREDAKTGVITTTLSNQMTILKVVVSLSDANRNKAFNKLTINTYTDNTLASPDKIFPSFGWCYMDFPNYGFTPSGSERHSFVELYGDFKTPVSGDMILYIPVVNIGTISNGARWQFNFDIGGTTIGPINKDFTRDFNFKRGYIYTINVAC